MFQRLIRRVTVLVSLWKRIPLSRSNELPRRKQWRQWILISRVHIETTNNQHAWFNDKLTRFLITFFAELNTCCLHWIYWYVQIYTKTRNAAMKHLWINYKTYQELLCPLCFPLWRNGDTRHLCRLRVFGCLNKLPITCSVVTKYGSDCKSLTGRWPSSGLLPRIVVG
jgi:hypothetical protein